MNEESESQNISQSCSDHHEVEEVIEEEEIEEEEVEAKLQGLKIPYKEEFDTWDELATSYTIPDNWLEGMFKFVSDKGDKEVVAEDVSSSDSSKKKKKPRKKISASDVLP
ncbi:hypothetical protein R1sor_024571 [Riccia sorocarpa]|uniref:Uncharacterized protein n=1 Tax=Riccia sorocarpa TaxID=122646 RepID=A0ABD3GQV8_9MARC